MRKNIRKVIEAFRDGRAAAGGSCQTDGTTIYSYAMPIARWRNGVVQVISRSDAPSNTTRAQVDAVSRAFPEAKLWTDAPGDPARFCSGNPRFKRAPVVSSRRDGNYQVDLHSDGTESRWERDNHET